MADFTELKRRHRAMWASGDYDRIARGLLPVADHVVRGAEIRAGERVLDIACGTGNTALAAAARGAAVTGLDLTPELLDVAAARAADAGIAGITWLEGDAEDLPFPAGSFDVIVSSCGLMFAPDQPRVAAEVARVTRPGGRVAIQAWSRDGGAGRMFDVTNAHAPVPPGMPSPFDWADETAVRRLLGKAFVEMRFERGDHPQCIDTPEALADLFIGAFGPTRRAWEGLPAEGAAAFRDALVELFRGYVTPIDGKVRWGREYLLTLATRA